MATSVRRGLMIIAAFASLVWAWTLGFQWVGQGGNLLNLPSFFIDAYKSGSAAGFLTIDILFSWFTFMVWAVVDSRRIGLGTAWGVFFAALSFLGTCFAFPLYLVFRERWLDRNEPKPGKQ